MRNPIHTVVSSSSESAGVGAFTGSSAFSVSIKYGVWEAQMRGGFEGTGRERAVKADRPAEEAWSIGGDNKLVQWDLRTGQSTK
jgi:hypothetical protein